MAGSASVERSVQNESMTGSVVSAVAELTGTDPLELEPLYDTVDPVTARALFDSDPAGAIRPPSGVSFSYAGCEVVVGGDGSVLVTRATEDPEKDPA